MKRRKPIRSKGTSTDGPFSQAALNAIFQLSTRHSDCLGSRENSILEFKKTFSWGSASEYARTCAAFANRKGGHLVFGVDKKPHKMVGLQGRAFEEIDPEKVTGYLNEYFSPEIRWQMHIHTFHDLSFGLLYVYESGEKPVICTKNAGEVKEGQIYYRYNGRTQTIRYPDLRLIIDEQRRADQRIWLRHLSQISKIGVRHAGVLDLKSGQVTGAKGTFLVDESLLDHVQFIRDGDFRTRRGAPAVKIVGKAKIMTKDMVLPVTRIAKSQAIRTPDIITSFLDNRKVDAPVEYVRQVCFESSAYLPVYFYMKLANLDLQRAIAVIEQVKSTSHAKAKLLQRLKGDDDLSLSVPSDKTTPGQQKLAIRKMLIEQIQQPDVTDRDAAKKLLQMLRSLPLDDLKNDFVLKLVRRIYDKHFGGESSQLNGEIRYTVSYLDRMLNHR